MLFRVFTSRMLKNITFSISKHYFIYFNIQLYNTSNIKVFIFFTTSLKYNFFYSFLFSTSFPLSFSMYFFSQTKTPKPPLMATASHRHHHNTQGTTNIRNLTHCPLPTETHCKTHRNPLWNKLKPTTKPTTKPNPTHRHQPPPPTPIAKPTNTQPTNPKSNHKLKPTLKSNTNPN